MTRATRTTSWTRADGKGETVVTVEAARGYQMEHYRHNLDGDIVEGDKQVVVESLSITLDTLGRKIGGLHDMTAMYRDRMPRELSGASMVLIAGSVRVGIVATNEPALRAAIAEAIAEAEADPEWTAILAHRAEIADVERHQRNVERMITLDGHTY